LLRAYRDIAKRADPQLMKLFRTLPRTPYGVLPVPSLRRNPRRRLITIRARLRVVGPGISLPTLTHCTPGRSGKWRRFTLHEAVPGHHLQISIAQELGSLPDFRRWSGYTAFVEGWGLYSESLGEEMGFYTDPYSKFGQLTYEMWRAVRLRRRYGDARAGLVAGAGDPVFKDNAGKTEHDIVVEVDRYIVWPGQALAYKLGELKIKELRAFATKELGAKFDVRDFHDEVLRHGAVPLSVLDGNIREWVTTRKRG